MKKKAPTYGLGLHKAHSKSLQARSEEEIEIPYNTVRTISVSKSGAGWFSDEELIDTVILICRATESAACEDRKLWGRCGSQQ